MEGHARRTSCRTPCSLSRRTSTSSRSNSTATMAATTPNRLEKRRPRPRHHLQLGRGGHVRNPRQSPDDPRPPGLERPAVGRRILHPAGHDDHPAHVHAHPLGARHPTASVLPLPTHTRIHTSESLPPGTSSHSIDPHHSCTGTSPHHDVTTPGESVPPARPHLAHATAPSASASTSSAAPPLTASPPTASAAVLSATPWKTPEVWRRRTRLWRKLARRTQKGSDKDTSQISKAETARNQYNFERSRLQTSFGSPSLIIPFPSFILPASDRIRPLPHHGRLALLSLRRPQGPRPRRQHQHHPGRLRQDLRG